MSDTTNPNSQTGGNQPRPPQPTPPKSMGGGGLPQPASPGGQSSQTTGKVPLPGQTKTTEIDSEKKPQIGGDKGAVQEPNNRQQLNNSQSESKPFAGGGNVNQRKVVPQTPATPQPKPPAQVSSSQVAISDTEKSQQKTDSQQGTDRNVSENGSSQNSQSSQVLANNDQNRSSGQKNVQPAILGQGSSVNHPVSPKPAMPEQSVSTPQPKPPTQVSSSQPQSSSQQNTRQNINRSVSDQTTQSTQTAVMKQGQSTSQYAGQKPGVTQPQSAAQPMNSKPAMPMQPASTPQPKPPAQTQTRSMASSSQYGGQPEQGSTSVQSQSSSTAQAAAAGVAAGAASASLQTPKPSVGATQSGSSTAASQPRPASMSGSTVGQTQKPMSGPNLAAPASPVPAVGAASANAAGGVQPIPAEMTNGRTRKKGGMGRIVLVLVFVLLLGLGGFAAWQLWQRFSAPTPGDGGQIVLTYWGLWEPEEVMQPFIDEFESQHSNVTINYTNSSPTEYAQRLRAALDSGSPPDIFRIHNTWPYTFPDKLSRVPTSVYTNSEFEETFYPIAYQNLRIGNDLVAIPLMYDGLALYYNEDLFNKAGLEPPTDWTSFVQASQAIRAPSDGEMEIAGAAMGATGNVDHWPDIVSLLLLQNQADPSNPTNQLAYDAVTFYSLFTYRYGVWDPAWPMASESFAVGKVGMMLAPSWQVFNVKKIAEENEVTLNFKVIPVPQLPETNVTWGSYWAEAVAAESPNQEMAWEFVKYLSEKDTMRRMYQEQSKYREFGEVPSRKDLAPEFADHPYVGPYVSQAGSAKSYPLASGTTDVGGLNDRIIGYYEDAINETSKGTGPDRPMATAAQGVQEVLRSFGLAQ